MTIRIRDMAKENEEEEIRVGRKRSLPAVVCLAASLLMVLAIAGSFAR